jgi:hypothetical protein
MASLGGIFIGLIDIFADNGSTVNVVVSVTVDGDFSSSF